MSDSTPDTKTLLLQAFAKYNIAADLRAGIAALMGGESGFKPRSEESYAHTAAARLRSIFPSRLNGLTDAYIDSVKGNDPVFFELVYGHNAQLGNTHDGDGYLFRGRGLIQLTGRANYDRYGNNPTSPHKIGVDLVADPDRENEVAIAIETAIVYMLDRYKGGGWTAMKAAVGNSFGTVDATKNELFAEYTKSGEWNAAAPAAVADPAQVDTDTGGPQPVAGKGAAPQPEPVAAPTVAGGAASPPPVKITDPGAAAEVLRRIQSLMLAAGFYTGDLDGDFRGKSITAIDGLVRAAGQPGVIGQKGT